jgi:hypothetical protein
MARCDELEKLSAERKSRNGPPSTPPRSGNEVILPELVLDFSRPYS